MQLIWEKKSEEQYECTCGMYRLVVERVVDYKWHWAVYFDNEIVISASLVERLSPSLRQAKDRCRGHIARHMLKRIKQIKQTV